MMDLSNCKAAADNNLNVPELIISVCERAINIVRKGQNAGFQYFLPFFQNSWLSGALNPFPKKPWFFRVCCTSLLKTLWEKKKLFLTRISPFPTVFSTHLENFVPFFIKFELLSSNSFSLEESKICLLGKGWNWDCMIKSLRKHAFRLHKRIYGLFDGIDSDQIANLYGILFPPSTFRPTRKSKSKN